MVATLAGHDVLIEVHDFVDPSCSATLREVFSASHEIEVIHTIPDREKAQTYDNPLLNGLASDVRYQFVREDRPAPMEWFMCWSKVAAR